MKQNRTRICHICGRWTRLTYEHVPPRAAFNSNKAFVYFGKNVIGSDNFPWDLTGKRGKQLQRGIGGYTLCGQCNNDTGRWYANAFVDFTHKGYIATFYQKSNTTDWIKITLPSIYPLRIIKEIVAMFFSINSPDLSTIHRDLRAFVLSKEKRGLPSQQYGFYVYVLRGSISRYIGMAGILSTRTGAKRILSELSAPPFGYVFEIEPENKRDYCDITFFANDFKYHEKRTITLYIPIYESNTYFPADYRTKKQVMRDYLKNKLARLERETLGNTTN